MSSVVFHKISFLNPLFKVESRNVTNNSLTCKDDIQGQIFKVKDVKKMFINVLCFIKFHVEVHSFKVETPNVTNNSLICNGNIQGNYNIKIFYLKNVLLR